MKLKFFWFFLGIDTLICTIAIVFFFVGMADGSVSSDNIGIWITVFTVLTVVIGSSLWLKAVGYPVLGIILLVVLATPGILYGMFILLFVVSGTSWR